MIFRFASIATLVTLVATSLAQVGPGQDSTPWNPANWNTAYRIEYNGKDTVSDWINDPTPREKVTEFPWGG